MERIINRPNTLLTTISNFLNGKGDTIELITDLIKKSTSTELISSFAFLTRWITNNIGLFQEQPISDLRMRKAQHLIGKISQRVPPVILLSGVFDLNWGLFHSHWLMYDFFEPINIRLNQLRSYVKPFSVYGQLTTFPPSFTSSFLTAKSGFNVNEGHFGGPTNYLCTENSMPGLIVELESDPAYQNIILNYFKRLILNHASLDAFKPLIEHRNSRAVLTKAIMELLKELNSVRDATHEQLVFAFSAIFLYIHAFTLSNEIDGQTLCEFIQSRPYLSPFCILAMINHIPVNLYLFNLLTPRELAQNLDQKSELKPSQYVMVDLTGNKSLNPFVAKMPTILSNYFLSSIVSAGDTDSCNKTDDNDFLAFIHLSSATLYNKMKAVLSVARERQLGPLHVSSMGILLLRCITFSLQRTLGDCAETKMFTENFCSFVKTVFAILSIAFSDQLGLKFFDTAQTQPRLSDLTLRGAFSHLIPVLLHHQTNDQLIPFCISVSVYEEPRKSAHLMIAKLLQCGHGVITPKIVESLSKTKDSLIILEYVDVIPSITNVRSCDEVEKMSQFRKKLLERIGVTPKSLSTIRNTFVIDQIHTDASANPILHAVGEMAIQTCTKDVHKIMRQFHEEIVTTIRILTMTQLIQSYDFAHILAAKLKEMLADDSYSEDGPSKFELRQVDCALPIAIAFIGKLLVIPFYDLALDLLVSLAPALTKDSAPLHIICNFTSRFRSLLQSRMLQVLDEVVMRLPYADELYIRSDSSSSSSSGISIGVSSNNSGNSNINNSGSSKNNYNNTCSHIQKIAELLVKKEMVLIQDPDVINREYQSPFTHALMFAHCSLALSNMSDDDIAHALTLPIYDIYSPWKRRDAACLALAKLATTMHLETSFRYVQMIMEKKNMCEMALVTGRYFLMNCRIDVFKMICQNCQSMIRGDETKLDFFMQMIMPSFTRLRGDVNVATSLLCGFLESLGPKATRELQEFVADVVGLVYGNLGLQKSRKTIIAVAAKFAPEIKETISTCLVAEDEETIQMPLDDFDYSAQMHLAGESIK